VLSTAPMVLITLLVSLRDLKLIIKQWLISVIAFKAMLEKIRKFVHPINKKVNKFIFPKAKLKSSSNLDS